MSRGYLYVGDKQILTHGISGELSTVVEVDRPESVPCKSSTWSTLSIWSMPILDINDKVIVKDNLDGTYTFTTLADIPSNNLYSGVVLKRNDAATKYQVAIIDKGIKNTLTYTVQTIPTGLNVWIYYLDPYTGEFIENIGNVCADIPCGSIVRVVVQRQNGARSIYHKYVGTNKTDIIDTTTSE